jgi:DNA-binding MarR family transcriptional regulator
MERIDAVLRPLDLSFARYEILQLLSFTQSGYMPMTRLGSLLQVHPTSVTSAVERLVKQGYVERLRRDDDKRVVLACLTTAGRAAARQATDHLNAVVFEDVGLPSADVARLTELLQQIRMSAGDTVSIERASQT